MEAPPVRYAQSGDCNIAYSVAGDGPVDLVVVPGFVSNVDLLWQNPAAARFFGRLASFTRLIVFDKRGTGASDRVADDRLPTLEERMDDVRAVMDAAGSERAVLMGVSEGGQMTALFASTYPERTEGLIFLASFAHMLRSGAEPEAGAYCAPFTLDEMVGIWGTGEMLRHWAPSVGDDDRARELFGQFERVTATRGAIRALGEMIFRSDVRHVLPTIRTPTLVVHRSGDPWVPVEAARYLADAIGDARFVECPGIDHVPWVGDTGCILDAIEEFVTGERPTVELDRVLATVMFTDIVSSTERAVERGDRRWREILDEHDRIVADRVQGYRGRLVKSTGDGVLATFDGPARAVRAACGVRDALRGAGLEVRAGLHTGEIELRGQDVGGVGVHISQRVSALAGPREVLVSRTVKDLVFGSGLEFAERGSHELKGIPGAWELFVVTG